MPKSCTGSRYTGYSCTSSRLRKVASAVTGPGVTTWRLVRIRPRSASTTKPVACAVVFHSVSKARVWSTSMDTTLLAMRSSVSAQSGLPSTAAACCAACAACDSVGGPLGGPGGAVGRLGCGTAAAGVLLSGVAGESAAARVSAWPTHSAETRTHRHAARENPSKTVFILTAEQHQQPHGDQEYERHEHRGRADVLGESGERVVLKGDAVHGRFDGAVQQLHDKHQQHRRDQQRTLDPAVPEPQPQGYDDERQAEFLAESRLLAKRARQPVQAGDDRPQYAGDAAGFVTVYDCAVGFHVRSSWRAARTSSSRRTGMVCGALVTRWGSCSASFWICNIAATKASSRSLLSVSVGSISRHSGTSSGK